MMAANYIIFLCKLYRPLAMVTIIFLANSSVSANFQLSNQLTTPGSKAGGVAFSDYNNDGCVDALINTSDAGSPYLYTQGFSGNQCNSTFTLSRSFNEDADRSIAWGDFNNDGLIDFASNDFVYRNTDGTAGGFTKITDFDSVINPTNTEGMGWIDYDSDGDLDLFVENHQYGMRIYTNNGAISNTQFFDIHSGSITAQGDYAAVADYDIDGDVDIYARRNGTSDTDAEADLFVNTGLGGTISAGNAGAAFNRETDPNINLNASNFNKGGAAFCDFDGDGDLDLVRTDSGPNQIFERTASGWTPRTSFRSKRGQVTEVKGVKYHFDS